MEIVLYVLAGLALLVLLVLAGVVMARQHGPGPAEPAVPPGPLESPAAPTVEEPVILDEEELEKEALEVPEEGDAVPAPPPPAVEDLIAQIRSGDPIRCREAIDELAARGESALPALEAALEDPDPDVRLDLRKAIDRIRS